MGFLVRVARDVSGGEISHFGEKGFGFLWGWFASAEESKASLQTHHSENPNGAEFSVAGEWQRTRDCDHRHTENELPRDFLAALVGIGFDLECSVRDVIPLGQQGPGLI